MNKQIKIITELRLKKILEKKYLFFSQHDKEKFNVTLHNIKNKKALDKQDIRTIQYIFDKYIKWSN